MPTESLAFIVENSSLMSQKVKNLWHAGDQDSIQRWEDPPQMGVAAHSSLLAWRIPWTEVPGGWQSMGLPRVRHD